VTGLAYLAVQVVSFAGIAVIDHRWRLAFFRARAASVLTVTSAVALFLTWDVLGVRSGVFFRGQTDFMTGLTIAPEIPVEEVVFLSFLSYLALVSATGASRMVDHRRTARTAPAGRTSAGEGPTDGTSRTGSTTDGASRTDGARAAGERS